MAGSLTVITRRPRLEGSDPGRAQKLKRAAAMRRGPQGASAAAARVATHVAAAAVTGAVTVTPLRRVRGRGSLTRPQRL